MNSKHIHKVKWYYKFFKELSELFEVGNKVAEFFEKIYHVISDGIEIVSKVAPPVAFIIAAIGHVAVLFQLADKQHRKSDYTTIGARFISGISMFALAVTSLVLVQYTLPLLLAATAVETGLKTFKVVKTRLHIRALQKQLLTLSNSPERIQVEHEIVALQDQLAEHKEKAYESSLEVAYTLIATILVVIGLAIPVAAPFVATAVAVVSVVYTAYRYRDSIQRFFSRTASLLNRLGKRLGLVSKDKSETDSDTISNQNQDADAHQEIDQVHETESQQDADSVQPPIVPLAPSESSESSEAAEQAQAAKVAARHFLHDQEHVLEAAAMMAPHPHSFAEAHADDALQAQQQQTTDFLHREEQAKEQMVVADEGFSEDRKEDSVEENKREDDDDDGGESGGTNGSQCHYDEDDSGGESDADEGAPVESEKEAPTLHL